jgi:hypothetical protein
MAACMPRSSTWRASRRTAGHWSCVRLIGVNMDIANHNPRLEFLRGLSLTAMARPASSVGLGSPFGRGQGLLTALQLVLCHQGKVRALTALAPAGPADHRGWR